MDAPIRRAAALSWVLGITVAGCSAMPPEPSDGAGLPEGVSVSILQTRSDGADRRLQVRVQNATDAALQVSELEFDSPRFTAPASYPRVPATVRAGRTVDFPVLLAEPRCDTDDLSAEVTIHFAVDGGRMRHATVRPDDPLGHLPQLTGRDCLDASLAEIATIAEAPALRFTEVSGRPVALLDVMVTPTGASGSFVIEAVDATVLLGLIEPSSGVALDSLPLGITVSAAEGPRTLTIPIVANRCDPHYVAEDKRGTIFGLRVRIDDTSGVSYFAVADKTKAALYAFIKDSCARR